MNFVDANGLRFAYLSEGRGPLALFLHGFPDTAHTWDRVMTDVARAGYRAVAPFMRGYHPTEIPEDGRFDIDTLGQDVLALIAALGEQRAIVIGHDWGATAAYAAAALAPEHVRLLVTLAIPHPRAITPTPRQLWSLRHFFVLRRSGIAEKIRATNFAMIDELWRRWSPTWPDLPATETEPVKAALGQPGSIEAACSYYRALSMTGKLSASAKLQITMPSVAFAGAADHMMKAHTFEKAAIAFDASYKVIQVPGGHFMHRERPNELVPELLRVLHDHAPPGS